MWCCKFCGKEFDNLTPSGKQHTRNKEAITHDLLRDTFLNEKGLKTYRITWKGLQQNIDDEIPKFLKYLNDIS